MTNSESISKAADVKKKYRKGSQAVISQKKNGKKTLHPNWYLNENPSQISFRPKEVLQVPQEDKGLSRNYWTHLSMVPHDGEWAGH